MLPFSRSLSLSLALALSLGLFLFPVEIPLKDNLNAPFGLNTESASFPSMPVFTTDLNYARQADEFDTLPVGMMTPTALQQKPMYGRPRETSTTTTTNFIPSFSGTRDSSGHYAAPTVSMYSYMYPGEAMGIRDSSEHLYGEYDKFHMVATTALTQRVKGVPLKHSGLPHGSSVTFMQYGPDSFTTKWPVFEPISSPSAPSFRTYGRSPKVRPASYRTYGTTTSRPPVRAASSGFRDYDGSGSIRSPIFRDYEAISAPAKFPTYPSFGDYDSSESYTMPRSSSFDEASITDYAYSSYRPEFHHHQDYFKK